jgi:hypothetical protein
LFPALYLGCKTNQKSTPLEYLLRLLIQGHQGPFLCFFGVFLTEEVDGVRGNGPGDSKVVDVQTLLEAFLNVSLRYTYFDEYFPGIKLNF